MALKLLTRDQPSPLLPEERALELGTALLLAGVPLVCSTWLAQAVEPPKLFVFRSASILVAGAWAVGLARGTFKPPRLVDVNLPLTALFAWWALRDLAILGNPAAPESLLTGLLLAVLTLVYASTATPARERRWARYPVIALGVVTLYSLLQHLGLDPVGWQAPASYPTMIIDRSIATMGNPDYLGVFMVGALPLVLLPAPSRRRWVLFAVVSATAILVQNRATWLAYALAMGVLLSLESRRPHNQVRRLGLAILAALALVGLWSVLVRPPSMRRAKLHESVGARLFMWDSAARIGLAHPLAGVGPGSYSFDALAYRKMEAPASRAQGKMPENPHNELLRILVQTGLPGLLLCLAALWVFTRSVLKHRDQWSWRIRATAVLAIVVNLLFICATITMQILLVYLLTTGAEPEALEQPPPRSRAGLLAWLCLGLWIGATYVFVAPVRAEYRVWWGDQFADEAAAAPNRLRAARLYQRAVDEYRRAQQLAWPARQPSLWLKLGNTYRQVYHSVAALPQIADQAAAAYRVAGALQPRDPVPYAELGRLQGLRAQLHPVYQARSVSTWRKAVELDPMNPVLLAGLAAQLANGGNFRQSAIYFKRSLDSYPDSAQVNLVYGRVLCRLGHSARARRRLERARRLDPTLAPRVERALSHCTTAPAPAKESRDR